MKTFFDAMFLASTAVFGGGAALAMLPHMSGAGEVPRTLAAPAVIVGLIALAGGMAGLIGVSVHPTILGVGIAGGALLFTLVGLALARSQVRAG
jgi:hypothetical protein